MVKLVWLFYSSERVWLVEFVRSSRSWTRVNDPLIIMTGRNQCNNGYYGPREEISKFSSLLLIPWRRAILMKIGNKADMHSGKLFWAHLGGQLGFSTTILFKGACQIWNQTQQLLFKGSTRTCLPLCGLEDHFYFWIIIENGTRDVAILTRVCAADLLENQREIRERNMQRKFVNLNAGNG